MTKQEFISKVAGYVQKHASSYGIKVHSPIIAQAILESNWGESSLSKKYHNYFGLKCGSKWTGKSVNLSTKEEYRAGEITNIKANFRVYDSMEAGIKGYFEFIQISRYKNLKGITDPKKYLETIKADGYATDSKYVDKNLNVIDKYNLTKYDNEEEEKMSNYASKVIDIALAEVGYLEKKSNKSLDSKTANAGKANYTKYGRDMHNIYPSVMDFPAAWCDCFVDWCFYKAFGKANAKGLLGGNFNDYTPSSAQLYYNKKAYHKKNPKVGDQIFFKNSKRICHTGLVYKVDSKYVYTIEGNTSGASGVIANGGGVCKKKYPLTYSKIDGYGRPKYDAEPKKTVVQTVVSAVTKKKTYQDTFPALPPRGYYKLGDGYETLTNYKTQIKRVQKFMNWCMSGELLKVDGEYGVKTQNKVAKFQEKYKLTQDGKFGSETLKKAKTIKK